MKRHLIQVSLLLILISFSAAAQAFAQEKKTEAPRKTKLSYTDYVNIIQEKLPELKKNRIQVQLAKNTLYGADAGDDTSLDYSFQYYREKPYSTNPGMQLDRTTGYSSSLGLSKRISRTGTLINSGIDYSSTSIKASSMGLDSTYYSPSLYLNVAQPVLKNAFGMVDRYAKNNAKMKLEIEKLRRAENDRVDMNYYRKLYFDWIETNERISLLDRSITAAEKLHAQTRRKKARGLADNDDVQKTLSALLAYREQREDARTTSRSIMKELELYLDLSKFIPDTEELENLFKESFRADFRDVPFNRTRTSAIFSLSKKNLEYTLKIAGNELLPEVYLTGGVTLKNQEDAPSTAISEMDTLDYSVGVTVSYPLGNTGAKSAREEARLNVEQINREYDISRNSYRKGLTQILSSVEGYRSMYDLKRRNIASLKSRYATEKVKYGQARINLTYLVDTVNSMATEEINLLLLKKQMISLYIDYQDLTAQQGPEKE